MVYVELMKNIHLVKLYVEFVKHFSLADSSQLMAVRLISASWAQKRLTATSYTMVYVEFMKNIHLVDSNEVMVVTLILACSAQKLLIPTS